MPSAGDAAALLAKCVAVVCEADLEGQLFTWVTAGVVDQLAPYDEGAQGLSFLFALWGGRWKRRWRGLRLRGDDC